MAEDAPPLEAPLKPPEAGRGHMKVFDVAKTVAIVSVIFVHSLHPRFTTLPDGNLVPAYLPFQELSMFVGFFLMQTLFFSSGYLLAYTRGYERGGGYWRFEARKAHRLLLPYAALVTAAFLARVFFGRYARRPFDASWENYVLGLVYPTSGPIMLAWFLVVLMGLFLFAPLVMASARISPRRWGLVTAALTAFLIYNPLAPENYSALLDAAGLRDSFLKYFVRATVDEHGVEKEHVLLCMNQVLDFSPYFWLGALAFRYKDVWERLLAKRRIAAATFGLCMLAVWAWRCVPEDDLYERLTILLGPAGGIMIFAVASRYVRHGIHGLDFLTPYSYTMYLTSWFFQQAGYVVCVSIANRPGVDRFPTPMFYLSFLILLGAGTLGPLTLGWVATRFRIPGRFLIGQ